VQADVLRAARLGQRGFNGVAQQIGFQQPVLVQFRHKADDLAHVSARDVIGKVRVAEDLLDQNELVLNLVERLPFQTLRASLKMRE
jgi:hypothetical protein